MPNHSDVDKASRYDGVVLILALLLIAAPWFLGYSDDDRAMASSLVAGVAIFACVTSTLSEFTRAFREVDVGLGLLTAAAPLLLGFGADHRAAIAHLVIGGLVTLISAGELLLPRLPPPHVST